MKEKNYIKKLSEWHQWYLNFLLKDNPGSKVIFDVRKNMVSIYVRGDRDYFVGVVEK